MERTLDILGTPYKICVKKYDEEKAFENRSIDGYCDSYTKQIVVCEMTTYKGWENEPKDTCKQCQKQTVRHEIVHAFLSESGLTASANAVDGSWARNEEMVDWIAWQGEKIYKAWKEADAL